MDWNKIDNWIKFKLLGIPRKPRVKFFEGGRTVKYFEPKQEFEK